MDVKYNPFGLCAILDNDVRVGAVVEELCYKINGTEKC